MAKMQPIRDIVLAAAVAVCGKPPKTMTPEQYRKVLQQLSQKKAGGKRISRERVNHHLREAGYRREITAAQNPKVQALIREAYKAVQKTKDPMEILALREKLIAEAAAAARAHGLAPIGWDSIRDAAQRLELGAWPKVASAALAKKKEPVTNEKIAAYMSRGRSAREIKLHFMFSDDEVKKLLEKGLEGYDLYPGPQNTMGEQTYALVPSVESGKIPERAWTLRTSTVPGQPYVGIDFPADFNHRKLRIVPLDGIFYGDPQHDAERFKRTIQFIRREPQTFCFLNGGIIAEIRGGKQEERDMLLMERTGEFERLIRPIMHKILWAQQGLEEKRSFRQQQFDPLDHICRRYGIPYYDQPVYADLCWNGHVWSVFAIHGQSNAVVKGAKMNALIRVAEVQGFTNFFVMGHIGDAISNRHVRICRDPVRGKLVPREEFHVILSNFKRYFGTDKARKGVPPSTQDMVVLYAYPNGEYHVKTRTGGH